MLLRRTTSPLICSVRNDDRQVGFGVLFLGTCRTPRHAQLRSSATAARSRLVKWRFSCGISTEATRFVAVARRSVALCCVRWRSYTMSARSLVLFGASTPSLTLTGGSSHTIKWNGCVISRYSYIISLKLCPKKETYVVFSSLFLFMNLQL